MRKFDSLIKLVESSIPVYRSTFYTGGKDMYRRFRKIFKNLPDYVANDLWNQRQLSSKLYNNPQRNIDDQIKGLVIGTDFLSPNQIDPGTGITVKEFGEYYLNGNWKLQILNVSPANFTPFIQQKFAKRQYGALDKAEGSERIQYQQKIATGKGNNEPVTILNTRNGLVLVEGYHRTMSILKLGDNGKDPIHWNRVKLRAWVCNL